MHVAVTLLKAKRGATIPEMMKATGWQSHSSLSAKLPAYFSPLETRGKLGP